MEVLPGSGTARTRIRMRGVVICLHMHRFLWLALRECFIACISMIGWAGSFVGTSVHVPPLYLYTTVMPSLWQRTKALGIRCLVCPVRFGPDSGDYYPSIGVHLGFEGSFETPVAWTIKHLALCLSFNPLARRRASERRMRSFPTFEGRVASSVED